MAYRISSIQYVIQNNFYVGFHDVVTMSMITRNMKPYVCHHILRNIQLNLEKIAISLKENE